MRSIFKKKELKPSKRVCLRLCELRKKQNISLLQMEKRTKISREHLIALETCQFHRLPDASVYQKLFLKR